MSYVAWFKDLNKDSIAVAGGKGANLGEMFNLGLPVPGGFAITAQTYQEFIEKTDLKEKIHQFLQHLDIEDTQKLQQVAKNSYSLCIFIEDGHSGVHGISASRLKDMFGRPTVFLTLKTNNPEVITGSIRGIDTFHVYKALQYIAKQNSKLFIAFGGHKGAGGITFKKEYYEEFAKLFEEATKEQLTANNLGPVVLTDGYLSPRAINMDVLETLQSLEPFGREFETPVFQTDAIIKSLSPVGDGTHARIELTVDQHSCSAIWFNFRQLSTDPMPVMIGEQVTAAFSARSSWYRGKKKCDLQILAVSN